jgi:hypothetical protein
MPPIGQVHPYSISDGTRTVAAPTEAIARKLLAICEANGITTDAQLDTFLNGLSTVAALRTAVIAIVEGLVTVTPGGG